MRNRPIQVLALCALAAAMIVTTRHVPAQPAAGKVAVPEEIAVAIMAEIVLVRRGGTGLKKSAEGPMAKAR